MDCTHKKTKPATAQKEFFGKIFSYKTEKCGSCGAIFWTRENQYALNEWLKNLKSEDQYVIQKIELSQLSHGFVKETMDKLAISFSAVIKGTLAFYCQVVLPNEKLGDFADTAYEKVKSMTSASGVKKRSENKKVRLGIPLYLKIYGLAQLSNMSLTAFSEDAIERALAPLVLSQHEKELEIEQRFTNGFEACVAAAA